MKKSKAFAYTGAIAVACTLAMPTLPKSVGVVASAEAASYRSSSVSASRSTSTKSSYYRQRIGRSSPVGQRNSPSRYWGSTSRDNYASSWIPFLIAAALVNSPSAKGKADAFSAYPEPFTEHAPGGSHNVLSGVKAFKAGTWARDPDRIGASSFLSCAPQAKGRIKLERSGDEYRCRHMIDGFWKMGIEHLPALTMPDVIEREYGAGLTVDAIRQTDGRLFVQFSRKGAQ